MFRLRLANMNDTFDIKELMRLSISELQKGYLTDEQIKASFSIMGIDTQLIIDGTYFCVKIKDIMVGCGGWSMRSTLYGGNHSKNRDKKRLNPKSDRGRIRAMYTHPNYVRQGVGSIILKKAEESAKNFGFNQLEMAATLSGREFYEKCGYVVERSWNDDSAVPIPMFTMVKSI
ncbi:MAG: GNAT family N-acetyltransferase [Hellea sp.]|nr:GNAT family N-acetyltransferase [Hellea sp.]